MNGKMPKFTPRLEAVSKDKYKIKFLDDSYPGKDMGNKVACHPIYGVYVIRDYLFQYKKTGDIKYKQAAEKVTDAAIKRMEYYKDSLVFWYKKESVFNSTSKEYYSALTQAYYTEVFAEMGNLTNNMKYREAAKGAYNSLKIPVSEGGVFHNCSMGPSIQEYPMNPNGYVLNGWFSALSSIKKYSEITGDKDAESFWRENLKTIVKMLSLYDAPHVSNSRYTLNGKAVIKLSAPSINLELQDISLCVPKEKSYTLTVDSNKNYANFIERSSVEEKGEKVFTKNYSALLKVLLSRYSYPLENEIVIRLMSPKKGKLNFYIASAPYSPTKIRESQKSPYTLIETVDLKQGLNEIKVKLPWKLLKDIGFPTTFKQFGDKWHNVYHFIHINRLEEFYKETKENDLLYYVTKWKEYVDKWPNMNIYKRLEKGPYGKDK